MRGRRRGCLLAVVAVVVVVVAGWGVFSWLVEPGQPSDFYRPPDDLADHDEPGEVLREEDVAAEGVDGRVWRVLHTSTGPDGETIAVSAVVAAPSGSAPDGGWPVVAWAHATTGVASRCAPSLEEDAGVGRIPDLQRLLDGGAVVVATDYPGLGTPGPHPYLVGQSEGRAVLDAVRAARSLLGDDVRGVTALFGHSQGGHAVVFAAELAVSYAPELELVGVAAMAPPTALGELLDLDQREPAGIVLTALAVTSWSELYADAREDAVVHPEARPVVASIGRRCIATTAEDLADLPDVAALRLGFLSADPATAPGWSEHLRANSPTTLPGDVPVLVAQGLADDIVRPAVTEAFVRDRCAAGARIELETYPGVDHFGIPTAAAGEVTGWLLERLQGSPAPRGCVTERRDG